MKRYWQLWSRLIGTGLCLVLALILTSSSTVRSQSSTADQKLQQAGQLLDDSFYPEALQLLDQVSHENPSSQYDLWARQAKAHVEATAYHDIPQAKAIYTTIAHDFPQDQGAFIAQMNLADIAFLDEGGSLTQYLAQLDAICQSAGGVPVTAVAAGSVHELRLKATVLSPSVQRNTLAQVYNLAASRLARLKPTVNIPQALDQSLALKLFLLSQLGENTTDDLLDSIRETALELGGGDLQAGDSVPPSVKGIEPSDDDSVGPYPVIRVTVSDGNIQQSQVAPQAVVFLVDGVKVPGPYRVRQKIELEQRRSNAPFLTLRISAEVVMPLFAGSHSLQITVKDRAGNATVKTQRFRVHPRIHDDHDDDHDDESRW